MPKSSSYPRILSLSVAAFYILVCVILDLLPHVGPPEFRYTGSDSVVAVRNIGWPMPMGIFDPHTGLHISPTAAPLLIAQVLPLFVFLALFFIFRPRRRR